LGRSWNPISLYTLALCAQQLGKETEAKRWLEKHRAAAEEFKQLVQLFGEIERNRDDPTFLTKAGAILLRTGRDAEGVHYCQMALKIDSKNRRAHTLLADYYDRAGKKELAEEHRKLAKPPEK